MLRKGTDMRVSLGALFALSAVLIIGTDAERGHAQPMNIIASSQPGARIVVGNKTTRIALDIKDTSAVSGDLGALVSRYHLSLILRGLAARVPPGDLYAAYLNLPEGAQPSENDSHLIGTFNVFNVQPLDAGQQIMRVLDMTEAVARLKNVFDTNALSVTLVPGKNVLADSDLSIGQALIVAE
jgi:hypothetical protein